MNTNNKKLIATLVIVGIIILVVGSIVFILRQERDMSEKESLESEAPQVIQESEIRFEVIRVLPSGFSPKEVTIEKGMKVRFTNPTDDEINIVWDGEKQYTTEAVVSGNDIATDVFDMEGTFTFSKEGNSSQSGKVVVD